MRSVELCSVHHTGARGVKVRWQRLGGADRGKGAGVGRGSLTVTRKGARLTGIDLDGSGGRMASHRANERGQSKGGVRTGGDEAQIWDWESL